MAWPSIRRMIAPPPPLRTPDDQRQFVIGDSSLVHRPGAAGDRRHQGLDRRLPGGEAAFAVLIGDRLSQPGNTRQIGHAHHFGEERTASELKGGPLHRRRRGQPGPGRRRQGRLDHLVVGHFIRRDRRRQPPGHVFIELPRLVEGDIGVSSHQVEVVGPPRSVVGDQQYHPDADGLRLDQPHQRQDGSAPATLLDQHPVSPVGQPGKPEVGGVRGLPA